MKKMLNTIVLVFLAVFISACSSDGEERPEYLDSYSLQGLQIPPRLTTPDVKNELKIPQPAAKALDLLKQQKQAEGNVAPLFKGIALKSANGVYWLEIEQDADEVWPLLKQFLANEGIKIYREEPLLGFIETDWVNEYEKNRDNEQAFFQRWFKTFSTDVVDKFRIRVERVPGQKLSRVYVSHRGLEVAVSEDSQSQWQQRMPEPMLEREMLYRMALFAGLKQADVDDMFAGYQPYQDRIKKLQSGSSAYEIVGGIDQVWPRLIHALDRLGVDVITENRQDGRIEIKLLDYSSDAAEQIARQNERLEASKAEDNELFDIVENLQSNRQQAPEKPVSDVSAEPVNVVITLQATGNSTQMLLSQENGTDMQAAKAILFRDDLVRLLK